MYHRPDVFIVNAQHIEVRPLPSKKKFVVCFNDNSPSKMMKNAFYFTLKALFLLKIFEFLS